MRNQHWSGPAHGSVCGDVRRHVDHRVSSGRQWVQNLPIVFWRNLGGDTWHRSPDLGVTRLGSSLGRKHDRAYLRIAGYAPTEVLCSAQGLWTGGKSNRVRCGSQERRDRKAERESAIRPCVFSPHSKADGFAAQEALPNETQLVILCSVHGRVSVQSAVTFFVRPSAQV